jgi:hypothetical protein
MKFKAQAIQQGTKGFSSPSNAPQMGMYYAEVILCSIVIKDSTELYSYGQA